MNIDYILGLWMGITIALLPLIMAWLLLAMKYHKQDCFEKFDNCQYVKDGYCEKIRHKISNGYSIKCHCGNCNYFKPK